MHFKRTFRALYKLGFIAQLVYYEPLNTETPKAHCIRFGEPLCRLGSYFFEEKVGKNLFKAASPSRRAVCALGFEQILRKFSIIQK